MTIYYLLLILAAVCFAGQFVFTKLYQKNTTQTLITTFVMLTIASSVGALLFLCINGFKLEVSQVSLLYALAFAVVMIPYYIISVKVLSLGSVAIYSMFMMLGGMLVPFLYGIIFLHEDITWGRIVGSVLLTGFIIMQALTQKKDNSDNANGEKKNNKLFYLLCFLMFFINGATGVITKAHQVSAAPIESSHFTTFSFLFTAAVGIIMLVVLLIAKGKQEFFQEVKGAVTVKPLIALIALGLIMVTGSFLSVFSASKLPASVQFPISSGGTIVFSAIAGLIIYKEKLAKLEWFSVIGAFAATFLFLF